MTGFYPNASTSLNYFTEVEECFINRRGRSLMMSPLDWALIEVWQEREIPLHIVIRSINDVFDRVDKEPPPRKHIKSLFYCREAIEVATAAWQASQVGNGADNGNGQFSVDSIDDYIIGVIEKLAVVNRPEIRDEVQRAMQRLTDLPTTGDIETIDRSLGDIEKMLDLAMLTQWKRDEFDEIERKAHESLKPYKAEMDADAYQNTASLMLLKGLREASGIPRLGLFYL